MITTNAIPARHHPSTSRRSSESRATRSRMKDRLIAFGSGMAVFLALIGAFLTLLGAFLASPLAAQAIASEASSPPHELRAARVETPPDIDGRLDDPVWTSAEVALGFSHARRPATQPTEVRVLYDDDNLYVGMRMLDEEPDAIAAQLGRRGATELHSDWAHVVIDSYGDGRTAFRFTVNPAGVKRDVLHYEDTREDDSWEAVWEVATAIDEDGWVAEFRIPFSQLRFSAPDGEASWGINFIRDLARNAERSSWAPSPPDAGRFVSLFGRLRGLRDLDSPQRLEILPYALTRTDRAPVPTGDPFRSPIEMGADVGLDLAYGLGPNLTFTATVNPDFGQAEVDPAVVNLSAFESFFPERRPFFLEGADIFRFPINLGTGGNQSLFYTRRIGRAPRGSAPSVSAYVDAPSASRILGAGKLSGRTSSGWSIGVLNAVTGRESARWIDADGIVGSTPVEPLTNHGVVRLSRDLNGGETAFGGMLTTVHRNLPSEDLDFLPSQAYALGLDGRHRFGGGSWEARGWAVGSHVRGDPAAIEALQRAPGRYLQRPDAEHVDFDPDRTSLSGVAGDLMVQRVTGPWLAGAIVHARSPAFDVNELGFQQGADEAFVALWAGHASFDPDRRVKHWSLVANVYSGRSWGWEHFLTGGNVSGTFQTRGGRGATIGVEGGLPALALGATRGGAAIRNPAFGMLWAEVHTDRRRAVFFDLGVNATRRDLPGHGHLNLRPRVTVRPSSRMQFSLGSSWTRNLDPAQYIGEAEVGGQGHYLFGRIAQTTIGLDARLDITFTPDLTLELFAQPFVSAGRYSGFRRVVAPRARSFEERFHALEEGKELREVEAAGGGSAWGYFPAGTDVAAHTFTDPGFRVRSLRGNAVLRWEYRPGSTVFFVWQQNRSLSEPGSSEVRFGRDLHELLTAAGEHVFMVKATYWIGG